MVQIKSLRIKLKEATIDWCLASTAHAIPKAARTRNLFIRLLWLSCFCASALYCLYAIVLSTQSYLSNQTYISTQIIQETPTYFPAVTFCNLKMLNKLSSKSYLENAFNQSNISLEFLQSNYQDSVNNWLYMLLYVMKASLGNDKSLTKEMKKSMGFTFSDMNISCTFNWVQCEPEDFKQFFHPIYGNCFMFNLVDKKEKMKQVSIEGGDYGLTIELFLGNPHVQSEYDFSEGIIVVVHNQSTIPSLNGGRVLVSTGAETDLKIQRNFISKLGAPYSDCVTNVDIQASQQSLFLSENFSNLSILYSQQFCFLVCLQKQVLRACNCTSALLPKQDDDTSCITFEDIICMGDVVRGFNKPGVTDDCKRRCPMECEFPEYKVTTSRATYPSVYYKKLLKTHSIINASGIAFEDIDKAVLRMNVFYESMSYNLITETPSMSSQMFFSNIGGTLGLCLGVSIISAIEFLELILTLVEIITKHNKKKIVNK